MECWCSAYEIIKLKGYTSWAIGIMVSTLCNAILKNQHLIYALSTLAKVSCSSYTQCLFLITVVVVVNVKVFPYSLPSFRPGADPSVQAVSPQVTLSHPPGGGCHYFPPGLRLPSHPRRHSPFAGTKLYCLPTEAHACEQLAQGCYWKRTGRDSNPRPFDS